MERMRVRELMELLAQYDGDAMVYLEGGSCNGYEFAELRVEGEEEAVMEFDADY